MKIAVLLFGHLRTFEYCAEHLKANILDKYDCDVFMHTWDTIDSQTTSWDHKQDVNLEIDESIKEKIKQFYCPKELIIEHQDINNEQIITFENGKTISINGINYMWQSLNKANNLKKEYEAKNNITYDYVLVTRPDVAIYDYLDIQATIDEAKYANLDINNTRFFAGVDGTAHVNVRLLINRIPDILYFAKPSVIDRYIASNINIKKEDFTCDLENIVQLYIKNEISNGIFPVQLCFMWNKDWKNIRFDDRVLLPPVEVRHKSKLYKFLHLYWLRNKE